MKKAQPAARAHVRAGARPRQILASQEWIQLNAFRPSRACLIRGILIACGGWRWRRFPAGVSRESVSAYPLGFHPTECSMRLSHRSRFPKGLFRSCGQHRSNFTVRSWAIYPGWSVLKPMPSRIRLSHWSRFCVTEEVFARIMAGWISPPGMVVPLEFPLSANPRTPDQSPKPRPLTRHDSSDTSANQE